MSAWSHPVLTCPEARALEERLFAGQPDKEWPAMERAGRELAAAILADFEEIGGFPSNGRVLVLGGKGHNSGDALIACRHVLEKFPAATAEIMLVYGQRSLRPLALRAYRELTQAAAGRITVLKSLIDVANKRGSHRHDLCIDGIFGFQFRPPVDERVTALLKEVNQLPIRFRAAVDLPSGLGDATKVEETVFRADFTYATGSVKVPVVNGVHAANVGRLRYLDLGFFDDQAPSSRLHVLTRAVLDPLRALRSPDTDKRTYGHLFVLGGSRSYPGAVLMTVLAALRSGVGLVTAFVPESLAPAFAARAPEAIWIGWPETPDGGLALEGEHLLRSRLGRAQAIAIGPGLGGEGETLALVKEIVKSSTIPLVLDADALQPEIVRAGSAPRVLTPHLGELRRILAGGDFYDVPASRDAHVIIKGRLTGITHQGTTGYYSPFGGPVLARGSSGDLLTGLVGGQLAQTPNDPFGAACRGTVWHGLAADLLSRAQGQTAAQVTDLLAYLPATLRA